MHYEKTYRDMPEAEADAKAVADIREYLAAPQWDAIMRAVGDPACSCQWLDIGLGIAGVQGYPIHAFIRTYRPAEYQAWFDSLPD